MSAATLWEGFEDLKPTPPAPLAKSKPGAIRYTCVICKRHMISYGEHVGELNVCESQECLIAWSLISAPVLIPLCSCPQREYPHELSVHRELRSESYNPANKFRWPWSLVLSGREEPSTERKVAA